MTRFTQSIFLGTFGCLLFLSAAIISGCSNAEEQACLDKASQLWDNKADADEANKAYWQAIEQCKEKYS